MSSVDVLAHPNVALIKYWGKRDEIEKIPATPSLSVTLGGLETRTTVSKASHDEIVLDGEPVTDQKILVWLRWLRQQYEVPPLAIESRSNFPRNCGFASSASGFAALSHAINELTGLDLDFPSLARMTRFGSASATRSLLSGYVILDPDSRECTPTQLASPEHWDLCVVAAVTTTEQKRYSSSLGMTRTSTTSPFYQSWVTSTREDFVRCKESILNRDFTTFATISEANCYRMHALMMSSEPPLRYWSAGTMNAIDTIEKLQKDRVPVFFTSDAGPQIKAVCTPDALVTVESALDNTEGVLFTLSSKLGHEPTISNRSCF